MFVIDAQVHVYEADRPDRPWDPQVKALAHGDQFLGEQLVAAMDEAGIDRAVLVPPGWVGYDNDYSLAVARRWPGRFAVMGRFDPTAPDARARLGTWLDQPGMVGIRFVLARGPWRHWIEDGTLDWFWPEAERYRIPVAVWAHGVVDRLEPAIARHPGLPILLCHAALPAHADGDPFARLAEALALARYPNVYAKVTALPCLSKEPYPFRDLHDPIRRIYDAFGPQRMLWGTDYTRLTCSYREAVDLFAEACDFLGEEDRAWILGRAAAEVLRWPVTSA